MQFVLLRWKKSFNKKWNFFFFFKLLLPVKLVGQVPKFTAQKIWSIFILHCSVVRTGSGTLIHLPHLMTTWWILRHRLLTSHNELSYFWEGKNLTKIFLFNHLIIMWNFISYFKCIRVYYYFRHLDAFSSPFKYKGLIINQNRGEATNEMKWQNHFEWGSLKIVSHR